MFTKNNNILNNITVLNNQKKSNSKNIIYELDVNDNDDFILISKDIRHAYLDYFVEGFTNLFNKKRYS